jgi:phi13 family phage major tail protein
LNKVTYGLENVHVALKGVAQVESIEVTAGCSTDGEITVTVTSAVVTGSPLAIKVALAAESHATVSQAASVVCNTLNNNAAINDDFIASNIGGLIKLTAKVVAANDNTLAIAFTPGDTGVTVGVSTNVTAGTTSWGVPIAIPGAVGFKPKAEGKESMFYADNQQYYVATSNNGYTGDLEFALVPDAILAEMLGWTVDANGMLVEDADGIAKEFALLGQVEGDERNRRFVYYNCKASRPAKENKTKGESIEPATDVLSLTITPIEVNSKRIVKGVMELSSTNVAAYNAFFNAVTLPAVA